ncbi:flagellar biosynthesis protein FlgA [Gorillibacterium sp. sgz5001074]|uniref:flagellar biosynthesis protein FlgA n=1 Tax=Gorillibacterium sp. sgz5001074 TaxID=3446695 RepID=UPI003F67D2E6
MRHLGISLAAALMAALLVYGVYELLIRQVELQETVQVVVPKRFIPTGATLREEMLEYRAVARGGMLEGMLTDLDQAVGQEAVVPLGTEEPVLSWKLDRFRLLPGPDEAVFPVPKEYLLSVPGSIRAGDLVVVYASGKLGTVRLLPEDIIVASVKSSANTEVDDPKQPHLAAKVANDQMAMYASRRDANGAVEQLNLNLTEEEWRILDEACRGKNNKLVIAMKGASGGMGRGDGP